MMAGDEEVEAAWKAHREAAHGGTWMRLSDAEYEAIGRAYLDRVRSRPAGGTEGEDHEEWQCSECGAENRDTVCKDCGQGVAPSQSESHKAGIEEAARVLGRTSQIGIDPSLAVAREVVAAYFSCALSPVSDEDHEAGDPREGWREAAERAAADPEYVKQLGFRQSPVSGTEGEGHEAVTQEKCSVCDGLGEVLLHEDERGYEMEVPQWVDCEACGGFGSVARPSPVSGTEPDTVKLVEALEWIAARGGPYVTGQDAWEMAKRARDALAGFSVDAGKAEEER